MDDSISTALLWGVPFTSNSILIIDEPERKHPFSYQLHSWAFIFVFGSYSWLWCSPCYCSFWLGTQWIGVLTECYCVWRREGWTEEGDGKKGLGYKSIRSSLRRRVLLPDMSMCDVWKYRIYFCPHSKPETSISEGHPVGSTRYQPQGWCKECVSVVSKTKYIQSQLSTNFWSLTMQHMAK